MQGKLIIAIAIFVCAGFVVSCSSGAGSPAGGVAANNPQGANASQGQAANSQQASGLTETEKPSAGKGNVKGKALFNEKPAVGVKVKLCQTFSQFMGTCGGETFTAQTDAAGEYLIKDVTPGVYEGLTVQVFDTPYYVFATAGVVSAAKYTVEDGKTFFVEPTHLFKSDLKLISPKAGAKVAAEGIELKWDAYPDAAYYKFSIFADSSSGAATNYDYINKRVEDVTFSLDKPLAPGNYTAKVEAYTAGDRKLAQTANDLKFSVK